MQPPKIGISKKKSTILPAKYSAFYMEITGIEPVTSCMPCKTKYSAFLVENSGIEPLTSCMPCKRSPS